MADSELIPPAAPSEIPVQPKQNFFRGPNGIRAGWRVLIFLAIVCAMILVLVAGFALIAHGRAQFAISQLSPQGLGISEAAIFLCTAIPALIMSKIERRKFGAYGLPSREAFRGDFWIGSLIGFLSISGCLLGIFAFHGFRLTGIAIHGGTILTATAAWAVAFTIVGLAEEFAFRGYLQFTLTTGMGFWPSAFLLSALFGRARRQSRREQSWTPLGRPLWIAVLLFSKTPRKSVVGRRIPCRMGLGSDFLLRSSRQRHPAVSQSLQLLLHGPRLANRRKRRPGGQHLRAGSAGRGSDLVRGCLS